MRYPRPPLKVGASCGLWTTTFFRRQCQGNDESGKMSTLQNTAGITANHPLHVLLLLLFFHGTVASAFSLVDCKQANAEQGSKWCKEAFGHTYSENKVKFLTSPLKTGCCLMLSLRSCVEFAFTKARCDPKEQKIALLIRDQVKDAQNYIKHGADSVTSLFCNDYKREDCGIHILHHFDQAIHNITVLNGSVATQATMFATLVLTMVGTLYTNKWV